jgi:hypothetical protein
LSLSLSLSLRDKKKRIKKIIGFFNIYFVHQYGLSSAFLCVFFFGVHYITQYLCCDGLNLPWSNLWYSGIFFFRLVFSEHKKWRRRRIFFFGNFLQLTSRQFFFQNKTKNSQTMSNPPSQSPFTFATFFPLGVPLPATPWHLPGPYTQPQRPPPLPTPPKKNPLFEAVKNKDTEELKRLLEAGFRPDEKEGEFDSPFRDAITAGYAEGVKLMSEYMDDIPFDTLLAISDDKLDPKERKAEMLSLLIQLGARFDRSTWRTTALHNLMHVSPDVVRIILDAYPELVNNGGAADYSALSYSLSHFWGGERDFHGLKEIISLLLDRGANPNPVSRKKGFHPINLLLDCDWEECRSGGRQFQEDILKKMLECGSQLPWLEKFTDGEQQHALGLLSIFFFFSFLSSPITDLF